MKRLFNFIILFVVATLGGVRAQEVSVTANPYTQSILIGEAILFDLEVTYPKESTVIWPVLNDTLAEKVEILSQGELDTLSGKVEGEKFWQVKRQMTITSFDSGLWAVPPIVFLVDQKPYETKAFLIEVNPVEIDTTAAIKDIREPIEIPMTCREFVEKYWHYGAYFWLAIMVLAVLAYFIGKEATKPEVLKPKPEIPAHILARQRLDELAGQKLWQKGKFKAFHVLLSEIIRAYMESRFTIPALESTTGEIEILLTNIVMDSAIKAEIIRALRISDMAKFAKVKPLPAENEFCLETAYKLVEKTIPVEPDLNTDNAKKEAQ